MLPVGVVTVGRVGPPTGLALPARRVLLGAARLPSSAPTTVLGPTGLSAVTGAAGTRRLELATVGGAVLPPGVTDAVVEVAEQAALPVGLLAVMAAFLALQARIDRRDPKLLATRSVGDDYLQFRPWAALADRAPDPA